MFKRSCYFLFAFTILTSCSDVVDTQIIEIEEKIFISSFISPENDTLTVNISRTLPALGLEFDIDSSERNVENFLVDDATVTISNSSGNTIQLPYLENRLNYAESAAEFPILPNERYTLTVTADGNQYTSTCTIPSQNITGINEQISLGVNEFGSQEYRLNLSFDDVENSSNFYIIGGFLDVRGDFPFRNNLFFDLDAFQTDNLGDGRAIVANANFFPSFDFENDTQELKDQDLVLQVINADEHLYQLLRTRYLNNLNEGDPFIELAVEPDNIAGEGGTGVFAGYRYFEKRKLLKLD